MYVFPIVKSKKDLIISYWNGSDCPILNIYNHLGSISESFGSHKEI